MNGGPQRCVPPEHVNRAVSGENISVDVVKYLKVRSSPVKVAPNPIDRLLMRQMRKDTEEEPCEDGGTDGREGATSPGTPGAPEAGKGRALSWSLWRDLSPAPR